MSETENTVNEIFKKGAETSTYTKAYVENQLRLKKIEASKLGGTSMASLFGIMVLSASATGIFFFLLAALSVYLNSLLGSYIYAFLAIAGIILVGLLFSVLILKPLIKRYTTKALSFAITGEDLPSNEYIQNLKASNAELKEYMKESAEDIPDLIRTLNPKDFLPDQINITKKENPSLKDKTVTFFINKTLKKIKNKK